MRSQTITLSPHSFTPSASFLTNTTEDYAGVARIMQQIISDIPISMWTAPTIQYDSFIEGYIIDMYDSYLSTDEINDLLCECWLLRHSKHPNLELLPREKI